MSKKQNPQQEFVVKMNATRRDVVVNALLNTVTGIEPLDNVTLCRLQDAEFLADADRSYLAHLKAKWRTKNPTLYELAIWLYTKPSTVDIESEVVQTSQPDGDSGQTAIATANE